MSHSVYTHEELSKIVDNITNTINSLKSERSDLTKNIKELEEQLKKWQELGRNQYKMFDYL